jgi:hypothetical protein
MPINKQEELVKEILEFLDELEMKQPEDLKTDNWRNWKYIRNSIVDKYGIKTQPHTPSKNKQDWRKQMKSITKESSDLEKYEEWVKKVIGKKIPHNDYERWEAFYPVEYTEYRTIARFVIDLYYKKHGDTKEYQKNEPKIKEIIKETVSMTMFIKNINERKI